VKICFSLYEYLAALFGVDYDKKIKKNVPVIQMDRKRDRMRTFVMNRTVFNTVLKKRTVADDKISTSPLMLNDTDYL